MKVHLRAVIISRPDCFKCKEIQEVLTNSNVPVTVVSFQDGASLLKELDHLPKFLPCTIVYSKCCFDPKPDPVLIADGLSEFLEGWENLEKEDHKC